MILVALAVVIATTCGVIYERRSSGAQAAARQLLRLMLYVLVPFVSFVNIAHLHVTIGAGVGLGLADLAIGAVGVGSGSRRPH